MEIKSRLQPTEVSPVLCDPHIREVVQAGFGGAFLEALPLCHFDLQSPGTTPQSENERGNITHVNKLTINSIISPVQILVPGLFQSIN